MRWLVVALCVLWTARAEAHEFTMSVMALRQVNDEEFVTRWERPPPGVDAQAAYLLLRPLFPEHCRFDPPRLRCGQKGLAGDLGFAGLAELTVSTALINVRWLDGSEQSFSFRAGQPQVLVAHHGSAHRDLARAAGDFTLLGVEHILQGWDHLLFVLGLMWLVRSATTLIETITAFTVAHSLALAAAVLGLTHVPVAPVEAVIALSIAFVAVELVKLRRGGALGLSSRAPWLVAFAFGLLHGLGFAGALLELELARADVPLALLFFNLGVELGQLTFVAVMSLLGLLLRKLGARSVELTRPLAHYAIGTLAMYWFVERMLVVLNG